MCRFEMGKTGFETSLMGASVFITSHGIAFKKEVVKLQVVAKSIQEAR